MEYGVGTDYTQIFQSAQLVAIEKILLAAWSVLVADDKTIQIRH